MIDGYICGFSAEWTVKLALSVNQVISIEVKVKVILMQTLADSQRINNHVWPKLNH